MKKLLLILGLIANVLFSFSQTQPTPQSLPYNEDFTVLTPGTVATYPVGFQGWVIVTDQPTGSGRVTPPNSNATMKPSGTNATTAAGVYNFTGKFGLRSTRWNDLAIALALNTSTVTAPKRVKITFDAMTMRNVYNGTTNDARLGLVFQYRIGTTGSFIPTTAIYESGIIPNATTGTTGQNTTKFTVLLPVECSGQSVVQVRWICKKNSGTLGESQSFAIDNVTAEGITLGGNYYVDADNGNDTNNGLTPATAWKSLTKVNGTTFVPGSKLFFKTGGIWTGQLWPKGSGIDGTPNIIDSYGSGPKPIINGNGLVQTGTLKLYNQSFWEINNLEITNDAGSDAERRGIEVIGNNSGLVQHIHLKNLTVHDVRGTVGSEMSDKRSAGIYFTVQNDNTVDTRFHNIKVEDCLIYNCQNQGIVTSHEITVADYPRSPDWERRKITNLVIRNNTIHHISKNAMIIRLADGGLVERNLCYETATGTTGNTIFSRSSINTVFQYNEGYLNRSTGIDGSLYDPDLNSPGTIWQSSYSHDNAHGLFWLCSSLQDTGIVCRYNISQNDKGSLVFMNFDVSDVKVYNNTFYVGAGLSPNVLHENPNRSHTYAYYNNIVYNANTATNPTNAKFSLATSGTGVQNRTITDNIFFKTTKPAQINFTTQNLTSDPLLVSPGTGGIGLNTVGGYKLKPGSPALNSGKIIANNGGKDYFGLTVSSTTQPNRGFYNGSGTETPFIPTGYKETKNLVFFELDKQGSLGTVEKVIADYNNYIVGTVEGFDDIAETKEDLLDKEGQPFDWKLRMDIIHPETAPSVPRPVFLIVATATDRDLNRFSPFHQIFTQKGYVVVIIDHAYSPLARIFGHNDAYYTLDDITGVKAYTAAVRYLRANASTYGIDPNRIGGLGHSKGSYAITRLSDPSISFNSKERFSNIASYQPQQNTAYASNIQVGYQSMGNGTRASRTYVTDDYAPTITAVGINDQYNHWTAWPDVVAAYSQDYDANWLGIPMLDKGHDMASGFQPDLGYVREEVVEKFFSNHLEPQLPPNILYVSPFNGLENENTVHSDQPVIIHFSPAMDIKSVKDAVQIVREDNNQIIEGGWKITRKGTHFEFTPTTELIKNKSYKVTVGTQAKSINGIYLTEPYERSFSVTADATPLPFTNPEPQSLPFQQNFTGAPSNAYPPGFQGWKIVDAEPNLSGRTGIPIADVAITAGSNTTTNAGIYNFSSKIGLRSSAYRDFSIALAVNTMSVDSSQHVKVTFDAMTMRNAYNGTTNDFLLGLVFQYRIGKTGNFIPTTAIYESNTEQNLTGTGGKNITTFSVILPKSCSGHPVIQLRWICKKITGSSGERQSFAIDNITVEELIEAPLELISFKGKNGTNTTTLDWVTESKTNSSHFNILRSADGTSFDKIGTVKGSGTSNTVNDYSFTDFFPLMGDNYYRLQQIDTNGKSTYPAQTLIFSTAETGKDFSLMLYPNPAKDEIFVTLSGNSPRPIAISIFDLQGRKISTLTCKPQEEIRQNITSLQPGLYLLEATDMTTNKSLAKTKFIKN